MCHKSLTFQGKFKEDHSPLNPLCYTESVAKQTLHLIHQFKFAYQCVTWGCFTKKRIFVAYFSGICLEREWGKKAPLKLSE